MKLPSFETLSVRFYARQNQEVGKDLANKNIQARN
jgi:hypothetical protein